jgi:hypothetical protein
MTYAYNPSYLEGRDREDYSLMSSQANSFQDPILANKKLGVVVPICNPSYTGSLNRRKNVQAGLVINVRPY